MSRMILYYAILALCIMSGAFAQVLFKIGIGEERGINLFTMGGLLRLIFNVHVLVGAILYGISFVLWLLALSHFDLSFMYPLLSLAYIITTFLSSVILGEEVHATRWIGVILITIGAILVGLNK